MGSRTVGHIPACQQAWAKVINLAHIDKTICVRWYFSALKSNNSLVVRVEAWIWALLTDSSSETSSILIHAMSFCLLAPGDHRHCAKMAHPASQPPDPLTYSQIPCWLCFGPWQGELKWNFRKPYLYHWGCNKCMQNDHTFGSTYLNRSNIITFMKGEIYVMLMSVLFGLHSFDLGDNLWTQCAWIIGLFFPVFTHLWYVYNDYLG